MSDPAWDMWVQLSLDTLAVAFFVSLWIHLQFWFTGRRRHFRRLVLGIVMGLGATVSLLASARFADANLGFHFPLLAIAGFFGGPVGGMVGALITGAFQISFGQIEMIRGLASIGITAFLGFFGQLLTVRYGRHLEAIFLLSLAVGVITALNFLTWPYAEPLSAGIEAYIVPVSGLSSGATLLAGLAILQARHFAAERQLLRAAINQAPDFLYVKDINSKFVAVNNRVASHHGFCRAEDMVGRSDHDIASADRAAVLRALEAKMISSGKPTLNLLEHLRDEEGEKWFVTSKVPVRDEESKVIGIVGVTRDATENRKLERSLTESRNLLSFAMSEMADGLAMFDRDGYLVFSNPRYRSFFPLTAHVRREGVHIREILNEVVISGEQVNLRTGTPEDWISSVDASLKSGGEEQVNLYDGRWLHIRTRVTDSGTSMVVVSDVTTIKQSEEKLSNLAGQLKQLAAIDGLTGLSNRRTFDETLDQEIKRTTTTGDDLSLLMLDVDHFKAYNDTYGHPAGDECLRVLATCMKLALRQSQDVLARYGGEEFAAILPATSDDGAFVIAERIRKSILDVAIPHSASLTKIVTASIGIATYSGDAPRSSPQLIGRADMALYEAKEAGRNRTMGWHGRQEYRHTAGGF